MSIKNLFNKPSTFESAESGSSTVESFDFIKTKVEQNRTFQPSVDFATASNFSKYGSAYEYYTQTIERIYEEYPYDGSEKEKIFFELSSSYLDQWVFDNKYPKTTGYVNLSYNGWGTLNGSIVQGYGKPTNLEYIYSRGGMHTASAGMENKPLRETFDKSVVYDASKNRTITYDINGAEGVTVEFWLKKAAFDHSKTGKEVILDLWNGQLSSSTNYGRLTLTISGSSTGADNPFKITLQSGSTGIFEQSIGSANITTTSLSDWSHYALSLVSASSGILSRLYKNGNLDSESTLGSQGFGDFSGLVNGYIGALQTAPSGNVFHGLNLTGAGKLSASVDDFRFWKTRRTSEQINNNWYRGIGGGTNTDDANVKLGVYYKFNEGVTGNSTTDSIVLDYSGRIANASWAGYSSAARSTSSAFTESGLVATEKPDPIMYNTHPDVISLLSEMQTSGSLWDEENGNMLYNSIPSWMREEDEGSNSNVKYLFQIISNYFDTLHAQITALPNLKEKKYVEANQKPLPFADRLLTERGIAANNLFVDSKILERFGDRDTNQVVYEKNLTEVKNLIYMNIYNNLEHIYKSKGTEKSIRNLFRCFGIDDEVVKLNVYTDGGTHYFDDKTKRSSLNTKYLNFNNKDYFASTVYQTSSVINTNTFVTGSGAKKLERYSAFTAEADIIVPFKIPAHKTGFFNTRFLSSSVYGFHQADPTTPSNYTWAASEIANLQVFLVRDEFESKDARFLIKNQAGTINLTSSIIPEIYNNQRWNLAVSVRPDKYELVGNVISTANPTYTLEFYGVTHAFDTIDSEFLVTASLNYANGSSFLSNAKRFYIGAHRTNFTGAVAQYSDLQIGSFRLYEDYLDKKIIRQHNLDPTNYGLRDGISPPTPFALDLSASVPSSDLLAINWNFDTVTGSNGSGDFIVEDFSSGSTDTIYGWIDNIIRREHKGRGFGFGNNKTSFVSNEIIFSQKKELPEISVISDNVTVKGDQDLYFVKDEDVSDSFYAIEKSMYQTISEEMLNMFSSIVEFNNLVGRPVDKYRMEYKNLNLLRRLFFDRVANTPDLDRYMEYFKWIDASISRIVQDLFPVSAKFSGGVMNVIDSHILERNKYQNKFPLTTRVTSTEGAAKGQAEMNYNWKTGHAPLNSNENENCLWQKERKQRTDIAQRDEVRKAINSYGNTTLPTLLKPDGTSYLGSAYIFRTLSRPYKLENLLTPVVHGGINYDPNKDRNIIHNFVQRAGPVSGGIPQNTFLAGQGAGQGIKEKQQCGDATAPNVKEKVEIKGFVAKFTDNPAQPTGPDIDANSYFFTFGTEKLPINIISGSILSGYNLHVAEHFHSSAVITNIHSDTTDYTNEIPMQGTFTQNWVGGHQHRHVDLNYHDALRIDDDTGTAPLNGLHNEYTREESWQILFAEYFSSDGAFGFVGADYGGPYPDPARKAATYYREERAKRPVNIKNIKTSKQGSPLFSHGNFTENYEIVQSFGKHENNLFLTKNPDQSLYLPKDIRNKLPETTHPLSLFGQATGLNGNVFGVHGNNRQPEGSFLTLAAHSGFVVAVAFGSANNGDQLVLTTATGQQAKVEIRSSGLPTSGYTAVNPGGSNSNFRTNLISAIKSNNSYFNDNYNFVGSLQVGKNHIAITSKSGCPEFAATMTEVGSTFETLNAIDGGSCVNIGRAINAVITGSVTKTIISSRFSAPGGIEISSLGYLDAYSREYSVHNNMNYRNLTVRLSGSGEATTIRMNSQIEKRDGLQTLLRRHTGKFGHDSQYGSVTTANYVTVPNFHKIHRNGRRVPATSSTVLAPVLTDNFDNEFINSPIPQSDFQYSWVTESLGRNFAVTSGKQRIYGYAPRDGILSSSVIINGDSGFFVPAINFPSASEIFGE